VSVLPLAVGVRATPADVAAGGGLPTDNADDPMTIITDSDVSTEGISTA
jgi:hypothetical protein